MRFGGLVYATLVFFVGIISILGFDENDIILETQFGKRNSIRKSNFSSFSKPTDHISDKFNFSEPKTSKYKRLSPYDFSFTIADLLTPDIFTQDDPLQFLIHKMNTVQVNAAWTMVELDIFLARNKFPLQYVPYAKALRSLLRIQSELDSLEWSIKYIRRSWSTPDGYFHLPKEFQTPELSELFSLELFSDSKPIVLILDKLLDASEDEILNVTQQLIDLSKYDRLPRQYPSYIRALLSLVRNDYVLKFLRTDISEMRRVAALNASSADQGSNDDAQENKAAKANTFS